VPNHPANDHLSELNSLFEQNGEVEKSENSSDSDGICPLDLDKGQADNFMKGSQIITTNHNKKPV